jgi:hypothetical protein
MQRLTGEEIEKEREREALPRTILMRKAFCLLSRAGSEAVPRGCHLNAKRLCFKR